MTNAAKPNLLGQFGPAWRATDGEMRQDNGVMFDRSDIWICRRCGAMVQGQTANHSILHKNVDESRGY